MSAEHRQAVYDLIREFAQSFAKNGAHKAKLDRYVDVLESVDLEHLRIGLDSLKGESSMPAPNKIRDAISAALMKQMFEREIAERKEKLRQLADPDVRAQLRAERADASCGLVGAPNLLQQFWRDSRRLGLVGESRAAKLVFLALHTRHNDGVSARPVSIVVKGSTSSGKSYVVKTTIRFLARGSIVEMSGMSPKWMVYASQQGLSLANKYLYVHEHTGLDEEVEGMLRVLLSEGRIIWRTVIDQVAHTLEVDGPTGLIETTTRISIHPENETRMLSIPVNDSTRLTGVVLRRMGRGAEESVDLARWHALDEWVALGPRECVIPYQRYIGKLARPAAPRMRRDMTTLLALVRAHALLHEPLRERDQLGRVVATLDDYDAVHRLTRDLFAAAADLTVSRSLRGVVTAVNKILSTKMGGDEVAHATSAEIARLVRSSRRVINRTLEAGIDGEYLEDLHPGRSKTEAYRVRIGSRSLPEVGVSVFPSRDRIAEEMGANGSGRAEETPSEEPFVAREESADADFIF